MSNFEVVHADAHSDLSFGDASCSYILTELPPLSLEQRIARSGRHFFSVIDVVREYFDEA